LIHRSLAPTRLFLILMGLLVCFLLCLRIWLPVSILTNFVSRQSSRADVALNAEMSKAIPFLVRPEKLDGSMAGDVGFDPMGLSEIQADLKYARWAELKHGRICMLAVLGMVTQEYGPFGSGWHVPGAQFTNTDPFAAVAQVGFAGNMQVFCVIGAIELATFNMHYGEGTPGDIGWDFLGLLDGKSDADVKRTQAQEIVHCRLGMIAFLGASVQTLLYHQPLLG
jgi:light-harvesting complex I chlorophyll a/b binding protein 1